MTKTLRRWLLWSAAAAVVAAATAGLWFAYARGWLAPAETWATGIFHRKEAGGTDASGMNMPGMNMPGVSTGQTSAVPGYTEVTIPYQVQQRIGVTLGTVEKAPLEMTVRTVGIVQPDETKVDHVHLKTEGWITKVFVNYTGQEVKENEKLLAIYSPEFVTTQETYLNDRKIDQSLAALDRAAPEVVGRAGRRDQGLGEQRQGANQADPTQPADRHRPDQERLRGPVRHAREGPVRRGGPFHRLGAGQSLRI